MPHGPFLARFAKNAGSILVGRVWFLVIWFAVTPWVLQYLGEERFGVWSLLFLLSGYLVTLDLGLATSVVKFVAEHAAGRSWQRLDDTLAQITRLYAGLGILWIVLIAIGQFWILDQLGISGSHREEVRFALVASAVVFAFANLISVGTGVLNGLQRMDVANGILVSASLPQVAVLLGGLHLGYGLYAVVASTALHWVTVGVANRIAIRRLAPSLHWPSLRVTERRSGWLGFSAVMQVNNLIGLTQSQVDKLFLAFWVTLRAVTEFELGFRVANALRSLPVLMLGPLLPAFAELDAEGAQERVRRLVILGTERLAVAAMGLLAATLPAAALLVRGWIGEGYPASELLASWLLVGFLLNLCTGVGTAASRGVGRPTLETLPAVLALAVHLVASRILIERYGAVGAGPAVTLAFTYFLVHYFHRLCAWLDLSLARFLARVFLRPALALAPAVFAGSALASFWETAMPEGRLSWLAGAAASALAGGFLYVALWWSLGRAFRFEEREGDGGAGSGG